MKPIVVGIVSKHLQIEDRKPFLYTCESLKNAFIFCGAIPISVLPPSDKAVFIGTKRHDKQYSDFDYQQMVEKLHGDPVKTNAQYWQNALALCDGIVFQLGTDTDDYEPFLAKYCFEHSIPILGISSGMTNVVKGLGGTNCFCEKYHFSAEKYAHPISIDTDSFTYKVLQVDKIRVNSRHYGKTCIVPSSLKPIAFSPDGTIEIIESVDMANKFVLLTRFNPESLYKEDENHRKLIQAFLDACQKRRDDK